MGKFPSNVATKWTVLGLLLLSAHVAVSSFVPRGFALTAFGDLTQCSLLLCFAIGSLLNLKTTCAKQRIFWLLMASGSGLWLCVQTLWTFFEVFWRHEVPNPFIGDVVLFLHVVPMMAAVAVQPHLRRNDSASRVGTLDFVLLLTWWLYLYSFVVIPWQYVHPAEAIYGRSFDLLYTGEQLVLVFALYLVWRSSTGGWRKIYGHFFGAALLYCVGSTAASEAIDLRIYYTGSLFDVPLVAAMAWFASIGFTARQTPTETLAEEIPNQEHGIWKARLAMLAVFVTPLMVAWAQFAGRTPARVRTYRVLITVGVMIVMGILVFVKQHLLDRELLGLLRLSRENLDEMRKLKDEIESKEQSLRWHSQELQRKNLELREISFTDLLTGVWNRRYLEEILTAEAEQVLRNYHRAGDVRKIDHRDLLFIMVDVDFFKEVNDHHGHPVGDRLLQLVAERLSKVVRKSDVLVRWGGEEFLIMSRSADPAGTPAFCGRILEIMASQPFDLGNDIQVRKTCSVGWTSYPWTRNACEALCAEEAIALADTALYRAKAFGRNQGVGIVPNESAVATPATIILASLQEDNGNLTRMVRVKCPGRRTYSMDRLEVADTFPTPEP